MAKGDFADVGGNWDETLLREGKYGEWFWEGMSINARSYLRSSQQSGDNRKIRCTRCNQRKYVGDFNLTQRKRGDHEKCNACVLRMKASQGESRRWETTQTPDWMDHAACKDGDPEVFFPSGVDEFKAPGAPWRAYCLDCPVAQLCEKFGAESRSFGVFGGVLFAELGTGSIKRVTYESPRAGRPKKAT